MSTTSLPTAARSPTVSVATVAVVALLAACALAFYLTAPREGNFWWSDSPRHAINGLFLLDLLRDLPLRDPAGWAWRYYAQYPSLTIGFYPPGLHAVLAVWFAVFGASHASAVACIAVFAFLLGLGTWLLLRRVASNAAALAATLLLLAMPELVLWGRQVMLDLPMLTVSVWAGVCFVRYLEVGQTRMLWCAAALAVMALYVKQNTALVALALLATLLAHARAKPPRLASMLALVAVVAVSLVPLMLLQLRFGDFNLTNIVHRSDVTMDRFSAASLLWYPRRVPEMMGWPLLLMSAGGLVVALVGARRRWHPVQTFLFTWLVAGLVAVTLIHWKETRHALIMLAPLGCMSVFLIDAVARRAARLAWLLPAVAAVALAITLAARPVPRIDGVAQAASRVMALAGPGARIAFSGKEDGAFIFDLRLLDAERRTKVVRMDKLLLDITIHPELGLNAKDLKQEEIGDMLNRYGIAWVVAAPGLWTEAPAMQRLERLLASPAFEHVDTVPVSGDTSTREFRIYRNLGPLKSPPDEPGLKSSIAG